MDGGERGLKMNRKLPQLILGLGSLDEEGYNPFPKTLLRRLANCPRLAEVDLPDSSCAIIT